MAEQTNPGPGEFRLFEQCVPVWTAGEHHLKVVQIVKDHLGPMLETLADAPGEADVDRFHFNIARPGPLLPQDVLGVYPHPGSTGVSRTMLPHIVLRRRTLPWEVEVLVDGIRAPWLVLLLLAPGEGTLSADRTRVTLPLDLLHKIMPARQDLARLAHVRQGSLADREFQQDDDGFVAVLLGSRLPEPGKNQCLVIAVDNHLGFDCWQSPAPGTPEPHEFEVLYSWEFTADADGADFETLCHRIGTNKQCQRFATAGLGRAPIDLTARSGEPEPALYGGPLVPLPLGPQDGFAWSSDDALEITSRGELDISYAAAFELGRLLALNNQEALAQLQTLRNQAYEAQREEFTVTVASKGIELRQHIPTIQDLFDEGLARDNFERRLADLPALTGDASGLARVRATPGNAVDANLDGAVELEPSDLSPAPDAGDPFKLAGFADLKAVVAADTWSQKL